MRVFITGATGFIGGRLTETLSVEGHEVTALVRNASLAGGLASRGIRVVTGDLFNLEALRTGMQGCEWVFHLAAYTRPSSKDPDLPFRTNVTGTVNILEVAKAMSVKRVILTSSAGTLSFSEHGEPVDENRGKQERYHTEYERTKAVSENTALRYISGGMDAVIVNPTRVYGPGKMTLSNSVTRIIKLYGQGLWRLLPGTGEAVGNYVFIDDVVKGLVLAAVSGKSGERYILGGENLSYTRFFSILGDIYGRRRKLLPLSELSMKRLATIASLYSKFTGNPPFITDEWIDRYLKNWIMTSDKAVSQLKYTITPFREGAVRTVDWLQQNSRHYEK